MEAIELADMGEKKLHTATNSSNQTVKLYGCKNDEFG